MSEEQFTTLMEVIQELSTEVWAAYLVLLWGRYMVAVTLSLDFIIILLTVFASRYLHEHLLIKPMGDEVDYTPPYSGRQQERIHQTFLRGLKEERRRHSSRTPGRSPPL